MKLKKYLLVLAMPFLLCAGMAQAGQIASYICGTTSGGQGNITGNVGDTILVTTTSSVTCTVYPSLQISGPSNSIAANSSQTYTLLTVGSGSFGWTPSAGSNGSVTVNVVNAAGTPSLSQWAQILLALLAVGTMAWYYRKQRQTH